MADQNQDQEEDIRLHIVVFPWLALGHLIPFLELSKCLAEKGHRISFVSTPRNLQRLLPKIPPNLSSNLNLISFPLPQVDNLLPDQAEATIDLPLHQIPYLKKAYDALDAPMSSFLETSTPDWIIYDFAPHWLPPIASRLGIPSVFFSIFTASFNAFIGPPSQAGRSRMTPEQFIKPVLPVGLLPPPPPPPPPSVQQDNGEDDKHEEWMRISEWLDKQEKGSVVYVALGTEATLSQEELTELALGLEESELPFFWVLRKPAGSSTDHQDPSVLLPDGFQERTKGRGFVCMSWAPQLRILGHPSVGGFLTHCGWSSIIEGLALGCPLILLPVINDQALNSRILEWKKIGLEIERDEEDGLFTKESVAKSLRTVVVEEEGETFRAKARELRGVFGDKERHDRYVGDFARYLKEYRRSTRK
ncbi:UDP-glucuronosyl/UDP-glucosyltransferase [Macleaya cordata]|uniref:Glycosyltransferase n=1 Tax=Macleaya cordata TaxID=56857 RepID=A0A200PNG5_MACCD|nr:UDP-glucuronosyl/UDP-glucosyltransferase [Macleaya cordata]